MAANADRIMARQFDDAGNVVSGLILEPIGLDGHGVANELWKIAAYLRNRNKVCAACEQPYGQPHEKWCPVVTGTLGTLQTPDERWDG